MIAIQTDAVRPVLKQINAGNVRYLCQFHIQVEWPQMVVHGNGHYLKTGKEGIRRNDGTPSAEYEADKGRRLWLGLDGTIDED